MRINAASEAERAPAPRRKGWFLGGLLLALTLIPLVLLRSGWSEHRRQQKDIDTWISAGMPYPTTLVEASRISNLGTNLLAAVWATLDTPDESSTYRALTLFRLHGRLAPSWRWSEGWKVRHALELLAPEARQSVALMLINHAQFASTHDPNTRNWRNVSHAFLCLGQDGVLKSVETLQNGTNEHRLGVLRIWNGTARTAPDAVLPAIALCVADPIPERRFLAVAILSRSRAVPESVPALGRALRDDSPVLRRMALSALVRFGPKVSAPALADLQGLLERDSDLAPTTRSLIEAIQAAPRP